MPSPFFMPGMSKNQYNSPDPIQTSTYKTSQGFSNAKSQAQQAYFTSNNNNQYKYNETMRSNPIKHPPPGYSSFGYSPSSNISSAQLFSSAPTPFQKSASNIRPPTTNQTAFQASLMLKEMQRNMQQNLQYIGILLNLYQFIDIMRLEFHHFLYLFLAVLDLALIIFKFV